MLNVDFNGYIETIEALQSGMLDTSDIEPYMDVILDALYKQYSGIDLNSYAQKWYLQGWKDGRKDLFDDMQKRYKSIV